MGRGSRISLPQRPKSINAWVEREEEVDGEVLSVRGVLGSDPPVMASYGADARLRFAARRRQANMMKTPAKTINAALTVTATTAATGSDLSVEDVLAMAVEEGLGVPVCRVCPVLGGLVSAPNVPMLTVNILLMNLGVGKVDSAVCDDGGCWSSRYSVTAGGLSRRAMHRRPFREP